jgi:hypothetical protein
MKLCKKQRGKERGREGERREGGGGRGKRRRKGKKHAIGRAAASAEMNR